VMSNEFADRLAAALGTVDLMTAQRAQPPCRQSTTVGLTGRATSGRHGGATEKVDIAIHLLTGRDPAT
jgi:hypothetical protein